LVMVVLIAGKKLWPLFLAILAVGSLFSQELLALIPPAYLARLTDIFALPLISNLESIEITDSNFSLIERAAHWQAAWRMFSLHPWVGVGLGQYSAVYPLVAVPRWTNPLGNAHNALLNTLAEGGLVGLLAYLIFQVTLLVEAIRTALTTKYKWLGLASAGTWTALFVHNLFDNLYVHYLQLVIATLFGLVLTAYIHKRRDKAVL